MVGIVSIKDAIFLANEAKMDLVEISPNVEPPVCKILDYGRYRYSVQKKRSATKKNQKVVEIKEIKIRPNIEEHDYQVKMRAIDKFFKAGNKVKITLRFRGREITHQNLGSKLLKRIENHWIDLAKSESDLKLEGKQMVMILSLRNS